MLFPYYSTSNPSLVLFSLLYKKSVLSFMHKVPFHSLSFPFGDLFSESLEDQKSEGGRNTLQYREPVIWNFANKIVDVWHSFNQLKICTKNVYHKLTWRLFLLTNTLLLLLTNPGILFILAFFTFIVFVQKFLFHQIFQYFWYFFIACHLYSRSRSAHGCQFLTHSYNNVCSI